MYIEELKKGETEVVKMGIETKYSIDDDPVDSWDEYFFNIARQTARNSKCLSRKIGAILVRDKSIISTGYNGPPRGIPRCDERWGVDPTFDGHTLNTGMKGVCPRKVLGFKSGEGMEICIASHGEESSIVNCARMGTCAMNSKMYLTCGIPCSKCAIKIINAGVEEVIVTKLTYYDKPSQYLFENSTVKIRVYDFIK